MVYIEKIGFLNKTKIKLREKNSQFTTHMRHLYALQYTTIIMLEDCNYTNPIVRYLSIII